MIRSRKRKNASVFHPNDRKCRNKDERSKRYMEFVKRFSCLVCNRSSWAEIPNDYIIGSLIDRYGSEAAHIGGNAAAKADNMSCVPLCAYHHRDGRVSEEQLKRRFWEYHELDYKTILAALHKAFEEYEKENA